MRQDIRIWCRSCMTCATRQVGCPIRPPLVPLPVSGAFDRVGVDVIQFVKSRNGNKYAVVFIDYLTKWVEAFAVPDQSALTIAKLLVEEIISRHGVPRELLSDRGTNFLSKLMQEVCGVMGVNKVNTTAYHPQGDGLVERFNRTLQDMLSKTTERDGSNWDEKLPRQRDSTCLVTGTREYMYGLQNCRRVQLVKTVGHGSGLGTCRYSCPTVSLQRDDKTLMGVIILPVMPRMYSI